MAKRAVKTAKKVVAVVTITTCDPVALKAALKQANLEKPTLDIINSVPFITFEPGDILTGIATDTLAHLIKTKAAKKGTLSPADSEGEE